MENDFRMAAAVTLYHPDINMVDYILDIRSYFEIIYLFDNTETQSDEIKKLLCQEGIKYATKKNNMGLAYGLNACCNAAYKDGFQWIILLDQDSMVTPDLLDGMKAFITKYDEEKLAVAVPAIDDNLMHCVRTKKAKKRKAVITSGMILKLEAFRKNGYFNTELFLDGVDFEFCLRLYQNGYYILENQQVALQHNRYDNGQMLQALSQYKVNKYPAIRYYYIYRNYFYIKEHYPQEKTFIGQLKDTNQNWLWGMLCYDDYRFKKILGIILGVIDYKLKRFGKCRWKILIDVCPSRKPKKKLKQRELGL